MSATRNSTGKRWKGGATPSENGDRKEYCDYVRFQYQEKEQMKRKGFTLVEMLVGHLSVVDEERFWGVCSE